MSTVIVGASAAGLAVAACLKEKGQEFELLEATGQVANSWRNHYLRLHLHTAKGFSGLPGFGFPGDAPNYPSREQVVRYLEEYARHFDLRPHFDQKVVRVKRADNAWVVETEKAEWRAENVVIATGHARVPENPSWPGQFQFRGRMLHSSEYKSGAEFKGWRVLVVGFGNSGGEIAIDLHEHGARPAIAVRSAVNVIPRDFLGLSILAWGIALSFLPTRVGDVIARIVSRITFGRIEALGFRKLAYGPMTQIKKDGRIPLIDVGTLDLVRKGAIKIFPGIDSFKADEIRFTDGREEPFDAVVLATGFRHGVSSFIDADPLKNNLPGLYFCGFNTAVATGFLREIGIEARRIANSIVSG